MKYQPLIVTSYFAQLSIPEPYYEYRFHPIRLWRFDIAWPDYHLAVEVNGGIWIAGGHSRGAQMLKDWEKWNTATTLNWRILFCQPKDLCTADFTSLLRICLRQHQ